MIRQTVISIFDNIWPMLLIFSVIIISIRLCYLNEKKERFVFYKEAFGLLFCLYIMILFYVVTFQDVSWSTSNFIPFKEMFRYSIGSPLFYRNVIGNMLMFLPYGFFLSKFISIHKVQRIVFLSFIASTSIEITQLLIGRVFDVDDILLNILGGVVGFFLYRFVLFVKENLPNALKKETFYNIIMVIFILGLGFFVYQFIGV